MTSLRIICVGRISPLGDEIVTDPTFQDAVEPVTPRLLTDDEAAAEAADYESWMDDVDWMRGGC